MATHPDLTRLRTLPDRPAASNQSYMVHIVHVHDSPDNPQQRLPQHDNHVGPWGDHPNQYGELSLHVRALHEPCKQAHGVLVPGDFATNVDDGNLSAFQWAIDWEHAALDGFPDPPQEDEGNEDTGFLFDQRYCVRWTDVSAHPWQGSIAQLDYYSDPWDTQRLLAEWLRAALIDGTAPQKRPGKTQPSTQPGWDDPWWDAK